MEEAEKQLSQYKIGTNFISLVKTISKVGLLIANKIVNCFLSLNTNNDVCLLWGIQLPARLGDRR